MIQSIAIVRLSAMGDVLMMVPLVRTLQKHFPEASITWIISRPAYFLVEGMEGVEFIVIDKPKSLKDYYQFYQMMKGRSFDVLLAPQASFRANCLYPLIKAKRKIGYDKIRAKDGHHYFVHDMIPNKQNHTLEGFLQFAEALGVDEPVIEWDLPISDADRAWVDESLPFEGRILLINPAASKPERSWLPERYIEVIHYIQQHYPDIHVVLTGGPTEQDRALSEAIQKSATVWDFVGKTKPKQLLALIERGTLMLCPDTGPAHMAVAMGTPVIALHAVTNPEISCPYGAKDKVINAYDAALKAYIPEKKRRFNTQVRHPDAMTLITTEQVIARLVECL